MPGCWLARQLHQLKASTATVLGTIFIFTCFFVMGGLGKRGLVDHNVLERDMSALLLTVC